MSSGRAVGAGGVREGDVLAGKYRVERVLGEGGMGVVVAAHHIQPEALQNAEAIARFVREARAAVKIKSEHVARVIDVGQLESGSPYIVMEYLEGGDLAGWLKQRGPLAAEQAVDFVLQACEALADAHVLGIVHRDLKPANLFCIQRSDGQLSIKVIDFGISKVTIAGAQGHDMTRTSALMGSPLYMSPEQMQLSKGVDARTDIWSLGVILFELITGRPPFNAEAVTELAIKVATEPAPPLRAFVFDAPAGLERVVAKCLEKDRAKRFQSVGELALALTDFGSRAARISVDRVLGTLRKAGLSGDVLPASAPHPQVPVPAVRGVAAPNTAASWGQTASRPGGSRGKTVLGIAVAMIAVAAIAGVALLRRPSGATAAGGAAASASAALLDPSSSATLTASQSSPAPSAVPSALPVVAVSALPPTSPVAAPTNHVTTPTVHPGGGSPAAASPPPGPAPTHPAASPSSSAKPATTAPRPNCSPPYVIDSHGDRQYKRECL
jgi:hypothetical protein